MPNLLVCPRPQLTIVIVVASEYLSDSFGKVGTCVGTYAPPCPVRASDYLRPDRIAGLSTGLLDVPPCLPLPLKLPRAIWTGLGGMGWSLKHKLLGWYPNPNPKLD